MYSAITNARGHLRQTILLNHGDCGFITTRIIRHGFQTIQGPVSKQHRITRILEEKSRNVLHTQTKGGPARAIQAVFYITRAEYSILLFSHVARMHMCNVTKYRNILSRSASVARFAKSNKRLIYCAREMVVVFAFLLYSVPLALFTCLAMIISVVPFHLKLLRNCVTL